MKDEESKKTVLEEIMFDDLELKEQNRVLKELDDVAMNKDNQLREAFKKYFESLDNKF